MRAVSDAGPLIHLSWIDQLALLDRLFEEVFVPPAVRDEVLASPTGTLGLDRIQWAFAEGWLQVKAPTGPLRLTRSVSDALDRGEAEALILSEEIGADFLITDDAPARAEAARRGLQVVGTVGVLTASRDRGLIPAALPLLLELRRLGQWISDALLQTVEEDEAEPSS
jgi:predicted nucleic acid-binding protein